MRVRTCEREPGPRVGLGSAICRIFCGGAMLASVVWFVFCALAALDFVARDLEWSPPDIEGHGTLGSDWPLILTLLGCGVIAVPVFVVALIGYSRLRFGRPGRRDPRRGFPVGFAETSRQPSPGSAADDQ